MFTFIMVAIIFFTGIALAVQLSVSVDKATVIIKEMTKYVEKFIQFMKEEAAKIKVKIEETDVKEHLKTGADIIREKTLEASKKVRSGRPGNGKYYSNEDKDKYK